MSYLDLSMTLLMAGLFMQGIHVGIFSISWPTVVFYTLNSPT